MCVCVSVSRSEYWCALACVWGAGPSLGREGWLPPVGAADPPSMHVARWAAEVRRQAFSGAAQTEPVSAAPRLVLV